MAELLDVVNSKDQVVGTELRHVIHREGLLHRAIHILLFNNKGEVFLQKRSGHKDTYPHRWDSSASGHLDAGEDYTKAAWREMGEEIGFTPQHPLQEILRIAACGETGNEFVRVYRAKGDGPLHLCPDEIEDGKWLCPEAVDAWLHQEPNAFAPAFSLVWKRFRTMNIDLSGEFGTPT